MSIYIPSVLAFVLVSSPETYKLTAGLLGEWVANATGKPQVGGILLHALVFLIVLRIVKMVLPKKMFYIPEMPYAVVASASA